MLTDTELQGVAQAAADKAWKIFKHVYPRVGTMPKIVLNRRLKTTAGRCDLAAREVDLSVDLMRANMAEFQKIIIPHELAHMVAWDIYKDPGHGADWKRVMVIYGIPPDRCHSLTVEKSARALPRVMASDIRIGDRVSFVHTNRQKAKTDIVGIVTRVNDKSYSLTESANGKAWRVPKLNNCNLRKI